MQETVEFGLFRKPYIVSRTLDRLNKEVVLGTMFQIFVSNRILYTGEDPSGEFARLLDLVEDYGFDDDGA
eukprot:8104764-Pyramimonas_sp.AAC.1